MQAIDVMTTDVITVGPDTPVQEIIRQLSEHRISAVPVVDENRKILGIISEGDLVYRLVGESEYSLSSWILSAVSSQRAVRNFLKTHGRVARDIMNKNLFTVEENTSISKIASILEKNRIKRTPVTRDGCLVGIVSRADLLRLLLAESPEGQADSALDDRKIRNQVQRAIFTDAGLDGGAVNVIVNECNVQLWGMVHSEDEKRAAQVAAEECPGVKSVENNLGQRPGLVLGD